MTQVKTTVEIPANLRDEARRLAEASDLNFQQYMRRLLMAAVKEQVVFGVSGLRIDLPMAANFVSGRDADPDPNHDAPIRMAAEPSTQDEGGAR